MKNNKFFGFGLVETILVLGVVSVAIIATLITYSTYQHKVKIQSEVSLLNQAYTNASNIFNLTDLTQDNIVLGNKGGVALFNEFLPDGLEIGNLGSSDTKIIKSVNKIVKSDGAISIQVGGPFFYSMYDFSEDKTPSSVFIVIYLNLKNNYCVDFVKSASGVFNVIYTGTNQDSLLQSIDLDKPLDIKELTDYCNTANNSEQSLFTFINVL